MRILAHRALINGPDKNRENNPKYIEECIKLGFDVEVDIWYEYGLFLGHDSPQYPISLSRLQLKRDQLWIHCKNFVALNEFVNYGHKLNYFWHENDNYTLTSNNKTWQAHTKEVSKNSIIVDLNLENDYNDPRLKNIHGVCTDYPVLLRERLKI